jgi:RNA polymerase sigma-70 factor (ECF subfamily)
MSNRKNQPDTGQPEAEDNIDSLIKAARQDPKAFGQLYIRYVQPVYRYLYSRIGNAAEAEDLTAQTFLAVLEGISRYRHDGHFNSWLFSIARRKSMDHFRRQRRQASFDESDPVLSDIDLLQQVIQTEQEATLARLIRSLPDDKQEILRLRYMADLSFAEIGVLLKQKEDTAKKALYRLLVQLQDQAISLEEQPRRGKHPAGGEQESEGVS